MLIYIIYDFCIDDMDGSCESNESLQKQTLSEAYAIDPWNHILIFLLYFFEYIIITGFFDRISQMRGSLQSDIYLERNLYTISQFLYQLGVLIARSSLY